MNHMTKSNNSKKIKQKYLIVYNCPAVGEKIDICNNFVEWDCLSEDNIHTWKNLMPYSHRIQIINIIKLDQ